MELDRDKTNTLRTHSVADVSFLAKKINSAQNKFKAFHVPVPNRIENVSMYKI